VKLGSLFDGSGTCPLAASAVGIIPAWASEIEPFPKAVTQSRFPKMVHLGDITKMNGEVIYLARKLTPTECASLQGFEKDWCALVPHKDSAEYKMWGNGIYLIMVVMRRTDVKTAPGEDSWRSCFT